MSRGRPRIVRPICGGGEEAAREARFLYIISRERPDLYRRISADFADVPHVAVTLDRRVGVETPLHERRAVTIHEDLEALGWAIVPQRVAAARRIS